VRLGALDSACGIVPPGREAPGLVPSQTSHTILLDPTQNRLRRMAKAVKTGARLHEAELLGSVRDGFRPSHRGLMITGTYAPGVDWSPNHISDLMKNMRSWCARRGIDCRYVWVMELTKVGRPHFHVLAWLPKGVKFPKPDDAGWWPHGSTKIEFVRQAVGYMAKYASKLEKFGADGNRIPPGARLHGRGGLGSQARREVRWWCAPMWVRERWPSPIDSDVRPAIGGGWCDRETGDVMRSPWRVVFIAGQFYAIPNNSTEGQQ
jgi:hypothetical protein